MHQYYLLSDSIFFKILKFANPKKTFFLFWVMWVGLVGLVGWVGWVGWLGWLGWLGWVGLILVGVTLHHFVGV